MRQNPHQHQGFSAVNLACGGKLCRQPGWINADHSPSTNEVMRVNLLKRLPFPDDSFDVVYHSQFIEHLPFEMARGFLDECHRVLKLGGVLRVVTPDLANQAAEYLRNLHEVVQDPGNAAARERYDWIRLEMLDQLTRHASGGAMVRFLADSGETMRNYLRQRMGRSGENMIPSVANAQASSLRALLAGVKRRVRDAGGGLVSESLRVGRFRLCGESHLCMYDQHLLSTLLSGSRFADIQRVGAKESRIPGWNETLLDCDAQGNPDCQVSLFMEARKPAR